MKRLLTVTGLAAFLAVLASTGCRDVPVDPPTAGPSAADTTFDFRHGSDTLYQFDYLIVTDTVFRAVRVKDELVRIDTVIRRDTLLRPIPQSYAIPYLVNHRGENDSVVIDIRYSTHPEFEMATRATPSAVKFELALPLARHISPDRFRFTGLKWVNLNVPRLTLNVGDTLALLKDPGDGAGAAIAVERKRIATGDSLLGRISSGWLVVRSVDTNRRSVRMRMHGDFLRWPEKPVAFDMTVQLGY